MTEKEPEEINREELMDYWDFEGFSGKVRFYLRMIKNIFIDFFAKHSPLPGLRVKSHRLRGAKIGNHVYIGNNVVIDFIYPEKIEIEDYVSIGMKTMIFAHSNPTNSIKLKNQLYPRNVEKTVIKEGAWIPPGCIILAGVTIGENSVIGAGSVVTKDIPPNSLAAGNPAEVVKELDIE